MTATNNQAQGTSSQTVTHTEANPILRLRPDATETSTATKTKKKKKAGVRWTEDVVDNENMNRKKSKICCIFHPQREFGELSSDDSSDASLDSSGDEKEVDKDDCCDHSHHHKKKTQKPQAGPNAYEKQPKYTNKSVLPKQ